jgi:hypothetical protein
MSTDLRMVDFTIQEEPGAVITTPSSWRIFTPQDDAFVCETCRKPIAERERMFLLVKENVQKGWRHAYLDDCGKIAYTVGLASSYEPAIDELAAKGEKVQKMGRMTADQGPDGEAYEGGWIWRTRKEAQAKLDEPEAQRFLQGREFRVYGVVLTGTWETDVSPELYDDGVHRLWISSKEVFRLP